MEKNKLKFSDSGKFRILMVSDFHCGKDLVHSFHDGKNNNHLLKKGLEALLQNTNPDFVMLGGDQCISENTVEETRNYLADIISPVIERKIPWGAVFGNHDPECGLCLPEQQKAYEQIPYCYSFAGPEDVSGVGNFDIPVFSADGSSPAFVMYGLDSSIYQRNYHKVFGYEKPFKTVLTERCGAGGTDGTPLFDQVVWYWNTSLDYEKKNGKKVPGVLFTHVPLTEYYHIVKNPEECSARGHVRDAQTYPEISSGLFLACLQRGDVKGMFFGHDHLTDLQGEYCGITMACDAALGYNMSAHDDLRGGRVIDLNEKDGTIDTYAVKLWDIMGKECMRDPEYMEGGCQYFIRQYS